MLSKYSKRAVVLATAGIASMGALTLPAAAWKPTQEVEIIAHVKTTSSTYAFASAVVKAIKDAKLLPKGIKLRSIRGARGGKARAYVGVKNKGNPHVLQVLTPSQINNPILAKSNVNHTLFRGVAAMVVSPMLMTVNAKSSYKSMGDIIEAARKKPGKIVQGGGAFGNVASLVGKMLADGAGVKINYTPFDDQGILQLLGGHVDFVMENPAQVQKFVKAGKMRVLAASVKTGLFKVPTFHEAGYKGTILKQYRGLWFSKDNSDAAVKFYIDLMDKVRKSKSFKGYVSKNSLAPIWTTGGDLDKMIKAEHAAYFKLGTELNLIGKRKKKKK